MSKHFSLAALVLLSFGSIASAHSPAAVQENRAAEWNSRLTAERDAEPKVTGTIPSERTANVIASDVQGRDLRSSTRGNAQFPERPYEAQNLGGTAGGPGF